MLTLHRGERTAQGLRIVCCYEVRGDKQMPCTALSTVLARQVIVSSSLVRRSRKEEKGGDGSTEEQQSVGVLKHNLDYRRRRRRRQLHVYYSEANTERHLAANAEQGFTNYGVVLAFHPHADRSTAPTFPQILYCR